MFQRSIAFLPLTFATLLGACGGAGGGGGIASAPPPPNAPTSTPSPAPAPAPAKQAIGLESPRDFATLGVSFSTEEVKEPRWDDMSIRYMAAEDAYEVSIPGFAPGRMSVQQIYAYAGGGGRAYSKVLMGQGPALQDLSVSTYIPNTPERAYSYTSYGSWSGYLANSSPDGKFESIGHFVYGIPTAQGDVPTNGTASYSAEILGGVNSQGVSNVTGSARLVFDFLAGTLSGSMEPTIHDAWNAYPLGTYTFRNTIFSRGSTTFSGSFDVPGKPGAASSFEGMFTGPAASELMARWQAPFDIPA